MNRDKQSIYTIKDIALIAIFAAIISVLSLIVIPVGTVPFTLQTFGVFLVSATLGAKRGITCIVIYVLLGTLGLPIFGGQGGLQKILGPTGGFITGFIMASMIIALAVKISAKVTGKLRLIIIILGMFLGDVLCMLLGTLQFMVVEKVSMAAAFGYCVLPFIIPEIIKITVAAVLSINIRKRIPKI